MSPQKHQPTSRTYSSPCSTSVTTHPLSPRYLASRPLRHGALATRFPITQQRDARTADGHFRVRFHSTPTLTTTSRHCFHCLSLSRHTSASVPHAFRRSFHAPSTTTATFHRASISRSQRFAASLRSASHSISTSTFSATIPTPMRPETPNHALQRTAPRVTVAATSCPGVFTPSHLFP